MPNTKAEKNMALERHSRQPRHPLHDAMFELVSAQSALNMPPELLVEPLDDSGFLATTDKWAAHAQEHLCAAFQNVSRAETLFEQLLTAVALADTPAQLQEARKLAVKILLETHENTDRASWNDVLGPEDVE